MTKDLSFKDFFDLDENRPTLPAQVERIGQLVAAVSSPSLASLGASRSKQEQFSEEISDMSVSDSFITEFSDQLGAPGLDESEETFVRRAKTVLREALRAKFRYR